MVSSTGAPQKIVYFGDSLSDDGNLFSLTQGLIDEDVRNALAGPTQSVSDGPVFTEYVTNILGIAESYNYAVAGSGAAVSQTLGELIQAAGYAGSLIVPDTDPGLQVGVNLDGQVQRFLTDLGGAGLDEFTAFILTGGNDYTSIDLNKPLDELLAELAVLGQTTGQILASAEELLNAGVGEVVIATMPPASMFPLSQGLSTVETVLADLVFAVHNQILENGAAALEAQGHSVQIADLQVIANAYIDDAEAFGFLAPPDATLTEDGGAILQLFDADQVAFYDDIHPSTAYHGVIGAYLAALADHTLFERGSRDDTVTTGPENALVFTYEGDDTIVAGVGDDIIFAGSGNDIANGAAGADLLSGGSGNDRLTGSFGGDIIDGDSGDDVLAGGVGDDLLIDGLGSDIAIGGIGADDFLFTEPGLIGDTGANTDQDVVVGGAGFWLCR